MYIVLDTILFFVGQTGASFTVPNTRKELLYTQEAMGSYHGSHSLKKL